KQRPIRRADDRQPDDTIVGEFAMKESDRENRAAQDWPPSSDPQEEDIQQGLEAAAAGLEKRRGGARCRQHEEDRGDTGEPRSEVRITFEQPEKEKRDHEVDG